MGLLQRGQQEKQECYYQSINIHHYLWLDLYGYLLPSIVLKNLSHRLPPSVQLDGFDISFEADSKTDVLKEAEGKYDVMHLRHFMFVLLAEEIKSTLEKLLKLLIDMTFFRVEKPRSGVSTQALTAMVNNSKAQDPRLRSTWDVRDAPSYMMTAMHEFNLVMHEILSGKRQTRRQSEKLRELMP
ncbi:hypothetical protein BDV39DRAFT_194526 [Aspergillus sergii]|uniref:Uncharacterized protein n=1 Tax=Aspergillus sergii TaxID=1034303 RepID=A0A5N6WWA5_9EURO|nr:hypothetical protein BDV39DRAFT_194526 [Aspergillus sergii]